MNTDNVNLTAGACNLNNTLTLDSTHFANGSITWNTAPAPLYYESQNGTLTTNAGGTMPTPTFVSDKFIKIQDEPPLYERLSTHKMNGAQLHPLLKKVIDEANSLERQKTELTKKVRELTTRLDETNKIDGEATVKLLAERNDLNRKISNQENTIKEMQIVHEELQQAHDGLKQVNRDYSEQSVNEIIEDYQTQIAYYESLIRDYERSAAREQQFEDGSGVLGLLPSEKKTDLFTQEQFDKIVHAFKKDLVEINDPAARDRILSGMNAPVGSYTQEQVDKMIEQAKLDLIAKQEAAVSHEEKFMELGSGAKVWQATTGRGPFWTQVLKPFIHSDKNGTKSFGWLVRNNKAKEEHFPIGDLTDKEPIVTKKKPSKLKLVLVGTVNAVATSLFAVQAFGHKAMIPVAITQVIIGAVTYWELSKK